MKLSTLSLALLSVASYISFGSTEETLAELTPTYHEPKNILFGCDIGGSSHVTWVLAILEEMTARGHQTFFSTKDDQLKFLKSYPAVQGLSSGKPFFTKEEYRTLIPEYCSKSPVDMTVFMMSNIAKDFAKEYKYFVQTFKEKKIDLAVCDHFNSACAEAAYNTKIPFVVTSTLTYSPDARSPYVSTEVFSLHHPVSVGVSVLDRFKDKIISPIQFLYGIWPVIQKINQEKKNAGIPLHGDPMSVWKDSIKIVNNVFGIEAPRPMGPLVNLVGPIIPQKFAGLNDELKTFLDHRRKVVYVGFGQIAIPTTNDITMIMTAMLENMESEDLDGIIWSTRGIEELFPDYITTQSNRTYDIRSLFNGASSPNETSIAFVNWAPQLAILNHPSTILFLTHGGAGSMYESFYQGVPLIVFPFFGDQPGTAFNADRIGFGRWMKKTGSQLEATEVVRDVARDQEGRYKDVIKRYQALIQIRSQRGAQRGADLMEEAIYTHKDGKMVLQSDIKNQLSTTVAYNIDIYALLTLLIITPFYGVYRVVQYSIYSPKTKLKSA
ncbi:unnamed protein product [Rhizopus stolonifer]